MAGTQNKLNDEIWVQINFYRLEMDQEQLDKMHHSQGKSPIQGKALEEKSGLIKVHETKTKLSANVLSRS